MQDRSVAKRDHIMKTAAVLFVEHGFEHTTLAMVAKASGAAIGSITHFFGDKSELAAAVLEDVARPLRVCQELTALSSSYRCRSV